MIRINFKNAKKKNVLKNSLICFSSIILFSYLHTLVSQNIICTELFIKVNHIPMMGFLFLFIFFHLGTWSFKGSCLFSKIPGQKFLVLFFVFLHAVQYTTIQVPVYKSIYQELLPNELIIPGYCWAWRIWEVGAVEWLICLAWRWRGRQNEVENSQPSSFLSSLNPFNIVWRTERGAIFIY